MVPSSQSGPWITGKTTSIAFASPPLHGIKALPVSASARFGGRMTFGASLKTGSDFFPSRSERSFSRQRPCLSIATGTISNRSRSRLLMTDAADCSETSCSPERPPYKTATRSFLILALFRALIARHQLAQNKRQNSAVPVVINLDRRIDAQLYWNRFALPVLARDLQRHHLSGLNRLRQSRDGVSLGTIESKGLRIRSFSELQWQHAHADQIRPMNALEARRHDRFHAEQPRSLRRPVATRSRPVLVPGENDERNGSRLIFHRRVVDRHLLAIGMMNRHAPFRARDHQVLDPDVGKCSASHHQIVAPPRTVAVKIGRLNSATF